MVKNSFAKDLTQAEWIRTIAQRRLDIVLSQLKEPIWVFGYREVWSTPDLILETVATTLGVPAPFNKVPMYNGDLPYIKDS
ncbi:MAG: hypothetical protein ACWGQW_15195 [bacterium]